MSVRECFHQRINDNPRPENNKKTDEHAAEKSLCPTDSARVSGVREIDAARPGKKNRRKENGDEDAGIQDVLCGLGNAADCARRQIRIDV